MWNVIESDCVNCDLGTRLGEVNILMSVTAMKMVMLTSELRHWETWR
jgi:hypothetical protein